MAKTSFTIDFKEYEKQLNDQCVFINFYLLRALRRIASHIVYLNDTKAFELFHGLFQLNINPERDFHRFHTFDQVITAFKSLQNAEEYMDELVVARQDWVDSLEETSYYCDNL